MSLSNSSTSTNFEFCGEIHSRLTTLPTRNVVDAVEGLTNAPVPVRMLKYPSFESWIAGEPAALTTILARLVDVDGSVISAKSPATLPIMNARDPPELVWR